MNPICISDLFDFTDLTNEIRGERLRFVDAMKEATSINIQGKGSGSDSVEYGDVNISCQPNWSSSRLSLLEKYQK